MVIRRTVEALGARLEATRFEESGMATIRFPHDPNATVSDERLDAEVAFMELLKGELNRQNFTPGGNPEYTPKYTIMVDGLSTTGTVLALKKCHAHNESELAEAVAAIEKEALINKNVFHDLVNAKEARALTPLGLKEVNPLGLGEEGRIRIQESKLEVNTTIPDCTVFFIDKSVDKPGLLVLSRSKLFPHDPEEIVADRLVMQMILGEIEKRPALARKYSATLIESGTELRVTGIHTRSEALEFMEAVEAVNMSLRKAGVTGVRHKKWGDDTQHAEPELTLVDYAARQPAVPIPETEDTPSTTVVKPGTQTLGIIRNRGDGHGA